MRRPNLSAQNRLAPLTEITDEARYGVNLVELARLAREGVGVLSTGAWSRLTFRRQVDKRQRSEHTLSNLLKQTHKHGHRARCRAAQLVVRQTELAPELLDALDEFRTALALPPGASCRVWADVVTEPERNVGEPFSRVSTLATDTLHATIRAAFSSAYEPELVRQAAIAGVKNYGLALAISVLPRKANAGTLWLIETAGNTGPTARTEAPLPLIRGSLDSSWFVFDGELHFDGARDTQVDGILSQGLARLQRALPAGSQVEVAVTDRVEVAALARYAPRPTQTRHWVCVADDAGDVLDEVSSSIVDLAIDDVVRPLFEEWGGGLHRRDRLVEPVRGRLHLDVDSLVDSLTRNFPTEGRWLAELLGEPTSKAPAPDLRFVLPRLFASLTVLETKLRTSMREFESDARQHEHWLEELDLSILPNDGLRNTLRETLGFVKQTLTLYLRAKFGMVRALTALTALAALSDDRRPHQRAFSALRHLGEVSSTELSVQALELAHRIAVGPEAELVFDHAREGLSALPLGVTSGEIARFIARHAHHPWSHWDVSLPRLSECPDDVLNALAVLSKSSREPRPGASRSSEPPGTQMVEHIAAAAGWLEKRAITAMLSRAASFVRVHERLRVWLDRCLVLVRRVLLDADRRLRRRHPDLLAGAVWQLGIDDIMQALTGNPSHLDLIGRDLQELAVERARRARSRAPITPLRSAAAPGATQLSGSFTGTGSTTGTVVRLETLMRERRALPSDSVLVCDRVDATSAILAGQAGALITELGNPFSRLAVLGRELGVPTVLGLGASLYLLKEGDRVFVDGDRGLVERLR